MYSCGDGGGGDGGDGGGGDGDGGEGDDDDGGDGVDDDCTELYHCLSQLNTFVTIYV